jgi:hypothetical protein
MGYRRSVSRSCPLWVKGRHRGSSNQCLLYPQKQTSELNSATSALCQSGHFSASIMASVLRQNVRRRMMMRYAPFISTLGDKHGETRWGRNWFAIDHPSKSVKASDHDCATVDYGRSSGSTGLSPNLPLDLSAAWRRWLSHERQVSRNA